MGWLASGRLKSFFAIHHAKQRKKAVLSGLRIFYKRSKTGSDHQKFVKTGICNLGAIVLAVLGVSSAMAATHFVNAGNPNALSPFTNWFSAASTMQAAVDVATNGEEVVVVSGFYQTGGVARAAIGPSGKRIALPSQNQLAGRSMDGN